MMLIYRENYFFDLLADNEVLALSYKKTMKDYIINKLGWGSSFGQEHGLMVCQL